jgi:NAD+ synthase
MKRVGSSNISNLPQINCKNITKYVVDYLRWYVLSHARKEGGVVGLSGGIDSAVTAHITVRALGRKNVYLYLLPTSETPKQDVEDALQIVRSLRVPKANWEIINIDPIIDIFDKTLRPDRKIERGNIIARTRMIILHQRAYRKKALVVGSGDKSELTVGYFTKYGDAGVDILPLGDLYKTEVVQLANYLKIPEKIIRKPPSPNLWAGQTAEKELGIKYEVIDQILYRWLELGIRESEISREIGVSERTVRRIIKMVKSTEHKRLPPEIIKLKSEQKYRTS